MVECYINSHTGGHVGTVDQTPNPSHSASIYFPNRNLTACIYSLKVRWDTQPSINEGNHLNDWLLGILSACLPLIVYCKCVYLWKYTPASVSFIFSFLPRRLHGNNAVLNKRTLIWCIQFLLFCYCIKASILLQIALSYSMWRYSQPQNLYEELSLTISVLVSVPSINSYTVWLLSNMHAATVRYAGDKFPNWLLLYFLTWFTAFYKYLVHCSSFSFAINVLNDLCYSFVGVL